MAGVSDAGGGLRRGSLRHRSYFFPEVLTVFFCGFFFTVFPGGTQPHPQSFPSFFFDSNRITSFSFYPDVQPA